MRMVRGRAATVAADRRVTAALREDVAETGVSAVRAWVPHRHLAFGRRDVAADGYEAARAAAAEHGFPPHERSVGGRAVAHTGNTVAFVRVEPVDDLRSDIGDRYKEVLTDLQSALDGLGVAAETGEPPGSFCPGAHSLSAEGKIAGVAQRVTAGAAATAGVVVARDHGSVASVLDPVYEALGVPFDPATVGSVERASGDGDPEAVVRAVGAALVGDRDAAVEHLG